MLRSSRPSSTSRRSAWTAPSSSTPPHPQETRSCSPSPPQQPHSRRLWPDPRHPPSPLLRMLTPPQAPTPPSGLQDHHLESEPIWRATELCRSGMLTSQVFNRDATSSDSVFTRVQWIEILCSPPQTNCCPVVSIRSWTSAGTRSSPSRGDTASSTPNPGRCTTATAPRGKSTNKHLVI